MTLRTFRLAHVAGDPLVGVQRAAVKYFLLGGWAKCHAEGLRVWLPGIPDDELLLILGPLDFIPPAVIAIAYDGADHCPYVTLTRPPEATP